MASIYGAEELNSHHAFDDHPAGVQRSQPRCAAFWRHRGAHWNKKAIMLSLFLWSGVILRLFHSQATEYFVMAEW